MHYVLKELNVNMGKEEYDMYQDIPAKESGSQMNVLGFRMRNLRIICKKK